MSRNNQAVSPAPSSEGGRESPAPVVQGPSAGRPQHKLTKKERVYLLTRLPEYHALQATLAEKGDGPRGVKNIKGNKKEWVKAHIFEDFKAKFKSAAPGGPALDSVFKEIYTWFNNNRAKNIGPGKPSATSLPKAPPKRPRAKNAEDIFADEQKAKITAAMSERRAQAGASTEQNLPVYNRLKKDLFLALPESERAAYEERASKHNSVLQGEPNSFHVFENQKTLVSTTIRTLHELVGHSWGQHGDIVFFVMGAYRDENGKINTFNASVGENPSQMTAKTPFNFLNDFPGNYLEDLRKPFKQWAAKTLPNKDKVKANIMPEPSLAVLYRMDGYPTLPAINFDTISPVNCRSLLTTYIESAWEFAVSSEESLNQIPPMPWDALDSAERRLTFLMDPEPFSQFKSLNPLHMPVSEIYDVLNDLSNAQEDEHILLQFNLNDDIVVDLISSYSVDQDIDEVPDPSTITLTNKKSTKKKSRRVATRKIIPDSDGSKSDSSDEIIPDFSPPSTTHPKGPPAGASGPLSPAMATPEASTERAEPGVLPEHIIVSALQAVGVHNTTIGYDSNYIPGQSPPANDTTPISPSENTMPSSLIPRGNKHPRVDSEQSTSKAAEDGRPKKHVRLAAPTHEKTEVPLSLPSATTPAKKGKKSRNGAKPTAAATAVPGKNKKVSATKVPKQPLPARDASKRINADGYKNAAVTIRRGA